MTTRRTEMLRSYKGDLPKGHWNGVFRGRLKGNQIKSAETAVGVRVSFPVTFRAGNHRHILGNREFLENKILTPHDDDQDPHSQKTQVTDQMNKVTIGIGKMLPRALKHILPERHVQVHALFENSEQLTVD